MTSKTKVLMALAIGAVFILIASTVVRCTLVHQEASPQDSTPAIEQTEQAQESQDAVVQQQPASAQSAMETLKANAWSGDGGKSTVTFKDGRFIESDGTATKLSTFDVVSEDAKDDQTTITIKLDQADGSTKDSMIFLREDSKGTYTVACDDFQLAKSYAQGAVNVSDVTVEGVNDEFRELLGGTTDSLQKAITEYAHAKVPTATKVTWLKELVISYEDNTVSANFRCDDAASTMLTVEYDRAASTFSVVG